MSDVWEQEHTLFWASVNKSKRLGEISVSKIKEQFDDVLGDFDVSDLLILGVFHGFPAVR